MTREMKDCGIKWIGEIPEEWETKPIKYVLNNRGKKNNPIKTSNILSLSAKQGVVPVSERIGGGNKPKENVSLYDLAYPNDIVLNNMNIISGSVGISKYFGCISPVYYALFPKNKDDDPRFYNYIFQTKEFQRSLLGYGNGILMKESSNGNFNTVRMRVSWETLGNRMIAMPKVDEQQSIANYLDHKTSQIDELVSNIEAQIAKLDEYKKALITQAVTKGLDPNAEMKDSGVKWIGDMPKEWHLVPAKHLIEIKKRIAGKEGYTVLSITQSGIKPKDITSGEGQLAESYANYQFINPGEFGMNHMDLLTGWIDISNHFGVVSPDYRVFTTRHSQIDKRYLLYLYQMCYKNKIFYSLGQGAALMGRWRLPATNMMNMKLPVPPVDEQKNIADFLDHQCDLIDRSIGDLWTQLTQLGSYKKSLIFDYVTGKKEVPADFRKEQSYEK
ncbi:restriction endonuclease subunit S [uncultured Faecalibaculum sp.]|uniref:restriction endonuclease subunit S n=1 Tax=uncultured Faecalibaculum sp. TaxID=1729681 RepID=UPI0026129F53|nr:restriction endonuclease subunit S [uncultured Faecalibaculum sp.]